MMTELTQLSWLLNANPRCAALDDDHSAMHQLPFSMLLTPKTPQRRSAKATAANRKLKRAERQQRRRTIDMDPTSAKKMTNTSTINNTNNSSAKRRAPAKLANDQDLEWLSAHAQLQARLDRLVAAALAVDPEAANAALLPAMIALALMHHRAVYDQSATNATLASANPGQTSTQVERWILRSFPALALAAAADLKKGVRIHLGSHSAFVRKQRGTARTTWRVDAQYMPTLCSELEQFINRASAVNTSSLQDHTAAPSAKRLKRASIHHESRILSSGSSDMSASDAESLQADSGFEEFAELLHAYAQEDDDLDNMMKELTAALPEPSPREPQDLSSIFGDSINPTLWVPTLETGADDLTATLFRDLEALTGLVPDQESLDPLSAAASLIDILC